MRARLWLVSALLVVVVIIAPAMALAHSGRTDSSGGHHDYQNRSGLGQYHYHHGMGPHLHIRGVCPYEQVCPWCFLTMLGVGATTFALYKNHKY